MPHQPVRTAPPPPVPQRSNSRSNNNHFSFLDEFTSDNNNNEQKSAVSRNNHSAPLRPQKKVPPPRPAPPKIRVPVSSQEGKIVANVSSKKKNGHSNGIKSGIGKYFNLKTGRAVNERAAAQPTTKHTKRRAPLPPHLAGSRKPPAPVPNHLSSSNAKLSDSLIDFSSPPPTPAQRSLANKEISLLDIDFDEKGSGSETMSLLDIDLAFQLDSRSVSSMSSGSSIQFGTSGSADPWGHTSSNIDDLLSICPSNGSATWSQHLPHQQKSTIVACQTSSVINKSSSFCSYVNNSSTETLQQQFKKPTIIRPRANDGKRASQSTNATKTTSASTESNLQHTYTSTTSSWENSSQTWHRTDISNDSASTPPSNKFNSSFSPDALDDVTLTYSPPEPQFPPPVLPSDTMDGLSDTSEGEQWCRALFDFKGENEDELTFSEGDYIRIEDFINLDWMTGSLRGKVGLVPLTFVELVQGSPSDFEHPSNDTKSFKVTALYTFDSRVPGDLNFQEGDVIEVVKKINQDWWYGKCRGREGQFPCNFVGSNCQTSANSHSTKTHSPNQLYRAVYAFAGEQPGDLSFAEGDKIVVTEVINSDWWKGKLVNDPFDSEGIFPCAFVQPFS